MRIGLGSVSYRRLIGALLQQIQNNPQLLDTTKDKALNSLA